MVVTAYGTLQEMQDVVVHLLARVKAPPAKVYEVPAVMKLTNKGRR
jgi:hypothetical protein